MHRYGRHEPPQKASSLLTALLIVLAAIGLIAGAMFGGYVLRSLVDATKPPDGASIPGGTVPGGTASGGTSPGTTPGGGVTPGTGGSSSPALSSLQIVVEPREMYGVQIGAFSTLAQAQAVMRTAGEKGLPAAIWPPMAGQADGLYRVRCGLVKTRAAVDVLLAAVRDAGYADAFVAQVATSRVDFELRAQSVAYLDAFQRALSGLSNLLDAELTGWTAFATYGMNPVTLGNHTPAVGAAATVLRTALVGTTPPADLQARHAALVAAISAADTAATDFLAAAGQSGNYPRAMSAFIAFAASFAQLTASWR